MAISPFTATINQVCDEKGLDRDTVIKIIEAALAAAYRKDYGKPKQIIKAKLNEDDLGKTEMFQVFEVVENDAEEFDEANQIMLKDAKKIKKSIKVGDEIENDLPQKENFGRIAAQTAKQVIIQRLQEAERNMLFMEFKSKENHLVNGIVQQVEGNDIIINLGKINALMTLKEQMPGENYYVGQRIKVYVSGVEESSRGPGVIVSRAHPKLISELFTMEVPEINAKTVEIKDIAREAGSRTKISVLAHQDGLDPVGSCVGQRGIRVQAVLAEINEEKIDIILWDENSEKYIANALSPAKVDKIKTDKGNKKAVVYVPEDQLSLAIGKNGQNVRLASKLTGWNIDIEKTILKKEKDEKSEELVKEKTDKIEKKITVAPKKSKEKKKKSK
jgi:N utilization substance protein A